MLNYLKIRVFIFLVVSGLTLSGDAFSAEAGIISLPEVTVAEQNQAEEPEGRGPSESVPEHFELGAFKSKSLSQELSGSPSVQPVPGFTSSSSPGFSLRGMDPSQTLVFIEGIPLTEPVFLSDNLSGLPMFATQDAAVFAEAVPASLLTNSLGGAVDLHLTNGPPGNTVIAGLGNLGNMTFGAQSRMSSGLNLNVELKQANENFSYLENNGTPFNPDDDQIKTRNHNRFKRVTFLPLFRSQGSERNRWEAFSITSFQAAEVPGPTFRPDPYQLRDWNSLNALKKKIALSNGVFGEGAVFFRFKKDDLQSLRSEQRQNEEAGDRSLNVTGGGRASLNWKNESWDGLVALGINYSKYDFEGEIQKVRQFAVERIEVPASLTADFKMGSLWKLKPACLVTLSDSGAEASPRVGFEVRPHSDLRIVGFGGSFFRRPSISEVYGNERGIGSNPDLRTETAFKGELGLVWFLSRSHFSLVFFGARAKDLISLTQIGPDLQRAENIGQASWLGQEVLLNLQSSWGGYLRPSFLSLWTRNESDVAAERGKSLPFRFPTTFRLETGLNQNNWNMGYRASFYSSSFLDRVNQERLAPYQLHDVFVRLKVRELGSFELNIQNLFNLALAKTSNAGVDSNQFISGVNGYPTAGRRIGFTWVYDL